MKPFQYFQPTEICFGRGTAAELGAVASRFGRRVLLVTDPPSAAIAASQARIRDVLTEAGLEVTHFDGVVPNPTTETVRAGAAMARKADAQVVVGLGGGSSMDTAKAIAVEATHEGSCWDYLFFRDTQPTEATLPVIAVTTTSGTGSQVTQVAVVTNPDERCKSALYHPLLFPRVAIVDPELTSTMPAPLTARTGFDAFTHAFESYVHIGTSPYVEALAREAMLLVSEHLPRAVADGTDVEARDAMAWADTLAGLCIANAGVTLPHGMGMAIGGMYPHVAHAESLAVLYPAFLRYTWKSAIPQFATLGRILDVALHAVSDEEAAARAGGAVEHLLDTIDLRLTLKGLNVPEHELDELAAACLVLPDYENNPRVATLDDVKAILRES